MSDYVRARKAEIREEHRQARQADLDGAAGMYGLQSVYVAVAGEIVKVGISLDPYGRVKALRCANPGVTGCYFASDRLPNASRVERTVHRRLKKYQVSIGEGPGREWFRCTPEIAVDAIKEVLARDARQRLARKSRRTARRGRST